MATDASPAKKRIAFFIAPSHLLKNQFELRTPKRRPHNCYAQNTGLLLRQILSPKAALAWTSSAEKSKASRRAGREKACQSFDEDGRKYGFLWTKPQQPQQRYSAPKLSAVCVFEEKWDILNSNTRRRCFTLFIIFWRTIALYLLVISMLRFMGKRQIGELQPSELVTTIMISNIAAIPIENIDTPLLAGALPIAALACFEVLSSALTLKSRKLRGLVVGKSRIVIHDGTIDQKELRDLRWSIDDLMEQLRGSGIFDISEVAFAVVETNGNLSVYQKFPKRPVTNEDLNLPAPGCDSPPAILINDGEVVPIVLQYLNLTPEWLEKTLEKEKRRPQDIFLMSCDRTASYHIVLKEGVR